MLIIGPPMIPPAQSACYRSGYTLLSRALSIPQAWVIAEGGVRSIWRQQVIQQMINQTSMAGPTAALVVLAAGFGSRFGGTKQVSPVGPAGESILEYSVYDAIRAGFGQVVFVIRSDMQPMFSQQIVSRFSGEIRVDCVLQDRCSPAPGIPAGGVHGTAHAVLASEPVIESPFVVVNADDYYGRAAYAAAMAGLLSRRKSRSDFFLVAYRLAETLSPSGPVSRALCEVHNGELVRIEEHTRLEKRPPNVVSIGVDDLPRVIDPASAVSMNFWGFTADVYDHLRRLVRDRLTIESAPREVFLPEVAAELLRTNDCRIEVLEEGRDWFGMTYAEDLPGARARVSRLVEQSVYPAPLWD